MKKPMMLMILDGYGLNDSAYGNAIAAANTPNLDHIFETYPMTRLDASGLAVGLPQGQMGNSEVGHLNIGAGRIVYQELTRITKSIDEGHFFDNEALNHAIDHVLAGQNQHVLASQNPVAENTCGHPGNPCNQPGNPCGQRGSALHLMGLLSDGGVHSHFTHLLALIRLAKSRGIENLYIHCFMDGRDVPPTSGIDYMKDLTAYIEKEAIGHIGLVSGRYYAMDRDKRWERVEKAYDALTLGQGHVAEGGVEAIQAAYERGETDEFILPTVCSPDCQIQDGDGVIMFNFRPDRAREITRTLVDSNFDGFPRKKVLSNLAYVCMTQYDAQMPAVEVAFPPQTLSNTLGEYVSGLGLNQLRIAETEKYAHVTFFFNGGVEEPNPQEDRILIPSPQVATYDMQPEMSAYIVTEKVLAQIETGKYDMIILNFANADMVGHTGVFDAAVKAVEALDICVRKIAGAILAQDGQILLTADHGNADCMLDEKGNVVTSHSTNQVPFVHIANCPVSGFKDGGKLADIAPTLLNLMGIAVPKEMSGTCLID